MPFSKPRLRRRLQKRDGHEAEVCPWCERRFADIPPKLLGRSFFPSEAVGLTLTESVLVVVTLEHIIAKRDGGTLHLDNVVLVCWWCNMRREQIAREGVQNEQRLVDRLLAQVKLPVPTRRRSTAFERRGRGWERVDVIT